MARITIDNLEYSVSFRHGKCPAQYGSGNRVLEKETDFTTCVVKAWKKEDGELFNEVQETVRRHAHDPENRVVARFAALEKAISHFPDKQTRTALCALANLRTPARKTPK